MIKRTSAFFLITVSLCLTLLSAHRAAAFEGALISDEAGLLSAGELSELNTLAENMSAEYGCEIRVLTVDDMGGGEDAFEYAENVFTDRDYGFGGGKSGLLLLLSMEERDYALIAHGYGNEVFTDYGKDTLLDGYVLPRLAEDDYYGAFLIYLNKSAEYLETAESGEPFDVPADNYGAAPAVEAESSDVVARLAVIIFVPLVISAAVCYIFYRQMKTAAAKRTADGYIADGGLVLRENSDVFLYKNVIRTPIQSNTHGRNSSGGTSVNSRGFSGRSGKF